MNRKVATIIILVVFVLSLVVVSLIGSVGIEWAVNITVTDVYITDIEGNRLPLTDLDGAKLVVFDVDLSGDINNQFVFYYKIEPDRAKNARVDFVYDAKFEEYITIAGGGSDLDQVTVTFKKLDGHGKAIIPDGLQITIRCLDGSEKYVSVYLKKYESDTGDWDG